MKKLISILFIILLLGIPSDASAKSAQTITRVRDAVSNAMARVLNRMLWINKRDTATVAPDAEGPTAVAGAATTVIGIGNVIEILDEPNFCVTLENTGGGGGGPLTDADIQVSPTGTGQWTSLTWTTCDTLAANATCTYCVSGNGNRYMRVRVTAAAGPNDTTVTGWYTGNKD